jgi:hypothetical protein
MLATLGCIAPRHPLPHGALNDRIAGHLLPQFALAPHDGVQSLNCYRP